MKIDKINTYTQHANFRFNGKLPILHYNEIDRFMGMENKLITAETDLIRTLSKKNPKLHSALKSINIPKYDIPLLKTLLINPVFDDEGVYEKIPSMLSTKWAWEDKNCACAVGRKNIADLYATTPVLNQNEAFRNKIGEIILNCTTKESSDYTISLINKYLNYNLQESKNLSEKLPDIIIKLQDSLYESRIDKKGISKAIERCFDFYMVSAVDFGFKASLGDAILNNYFKTL